MDYKIKTASGSVLWWMRLWGFRGWASLWNTLYIRPGSEKDQKLLAHEKYHLHQMARDGKIVFMLRYTWWLVRYGYWNNPYEIEARKNENNNTTNI